MIKYIGILLLSSSISLYGAYLASKIKQKNILRQELLDFIDYIEKSIKYEKKELFEIYKSFPTKELMKCGFLTGLINQEDTEAITKSAFFGFSEAEQRKISEFFHVLGKSKSAENEISLCIGTKAFLKGYFDKAKNEDNTKCVLYKKLGIITSIVLAIIFL